MRTFLSVSLLFLFLAGFSQSLVPPQPVLWFNNNQSSLSQPQQCCVGNHLKIPNDSLESYLNELQAISSRQITIFMVVSPNTNQSQGKLFWSHLGLRISDQDIKYLGVGRDYNLGNERPLILSGSYTKRKTSGGAPIISAPDTGVFSVAEILVYDRIFSKHEIRQVETYLSLKYSIPTTFNDDKSLRNYPGDSVGNYHWRLKRDKRYHREVISLGNFVFSGLQQTQTVAYHNDSVTIALDSIYPNGQMPLRAVQESGYIVMSEKQNNSSLYDCELKLQKDYPITKWRLRTENWSSSADSLLIYYKRHGSKSSSIRVLLTQGLDTLGISSQTLGSDLRLAIPLDSLSNNGLYHFAIFGERCADSTEIITSADSTLMAMKMPGDTGTFRVKAFNQDQNFFADTVFNQKQLHLLLPPGDNLITIENKEGEVIFDKNIKVDNKAGKVSVDGQQARDLQSKKWEVTLFPNPSKPFKKTFLLFTAWDMPRDLKITIHDAQGRMVYNQNHFVEAGASKTVSFTPRHSGLYSVTIQGENQLIVQKLIVRQSN